MSDSGHKERDSLKGNNVSASDGSANATGRGGRGRGGSRGRGGRGRGRSGGRGGRGGRGRNVENENETTVSNGQGNNGGTEPMVNGGGTNEAENGGRRGGRARGGRGGRNNNNNSSNTNNNSSNTNNNSNRRNNGRGRGGRGKRGGETGPNENGVEEHLQGPPPPTDTLAPPSVEHAEQPPADTFETMQQEPVARLNLPTPPPVLRGGKGGAPLILTRQANPPAVPTAPQAQQDYESDTQVLSMRLAEAVIEDEESPQEEEEEEEEAKETTETPSAVEETSAEAASQKKKPTKKRNPKKKRSDLPPEEPEVVPEPVPDVPASTAIGAMAPQEVSITASTQVKIRRNESASSLTHVESSPMKIAPDTKKKNGKNKTKRGNLSDDTLANQKAARRFNNDVRSCVERGDPDGVRALLHDRYNHNFALDHIVLETVMKAFTVAAMFEDAIYCLRNCTLPGTLSTVQTERILTCLPQNLRNSSAFTAADMINSLSIASDFDMATSRTYFMRIVRGIALEFLEEATSARDRICSATCERLVRSGLCVVNGRFKRGKKPTELIVLPGDQLGVFVSDAMENRGIQAGDAVSILPYAGPYPMSAESLDRDMFEATVTNTNPMTIRLQDKTNAQLIAILTDPSPGNLYRIDKLANRMGFNRQLSAAVAIASPLGGDGKSRDPRRPSPTLIRAITAMDENIDRVMRQSGNFPKGELTSTASLCAEAIPWSADEEGDDLDQETIRATCRLALDKYGSQDGLNASQQMAVEGATSNRLTLVQGPPGTGKTGVAIRILQHWARLATAAVEKGQQPPPILATSDSNIAVDNLVEGCASVGLRVVRLGRPEAIRPELLRFCIDRPSQNGGGQSQGNMFRERNKQLKGAQVICCTCIGSGSDILDALGPLDRVLVDEATQATEAAVLVPLMRGCRQLVLVGDHCQLPPTVLSTRAEEEGHGVPLFSRMVACGVPPFMLDTQYRMHPCIAMFPSDLFYGGLLKNGVSAPERRPLAGFPWPREEFPVAFMPVKGTEMDDGVSKYNEAEAQVACDVVHMLLQGGQCTVSDVAVVTPYAAQARLIRRMARRLMPNQGPPFIEVSSVDGFQGREKEAVVFSSVRSNDYGAIGFTSDWRRVNVSFTRARRALVVIGNDVTLRRGDPDTWMPWLAWADAHGINMEKPGVPRGRYEPEQLRRVRGGTTAAEMLKDVLARQQAQLKDASRQQERAEKNAKGHILGSSGEDADVEEEKGSAKITLEQDLAKMENEDGLWDDSDDEDKVEIKHSPSKATLSSYASSSDLANTEETKSVDVWDL